MEFTKETGRIALYRHGESVAYVTFPLAEPKVAEINHTFVSDELRGQGVGKKLLHAAVQWARGQGAKRLYISAHPAVESQAFYRSMGCAEAEEYNARHVELEPCDCQLECLV